jgi:hypothetical protein
MISPFFMWIRQGNIFDKHHAQVPVVDVDMPNCWRIYYSKRIDGKSHPYYLDVEKGNPSNILFESKEAILPLGTIGKFDVAGVMPTEIVTIGDKKYLYYIGWTNRLDVPYHNTLGLAISEDQGQTWKKFSEGPIFGTSYKEPGYVGTISILKKEDHYVGYYLSCREWRVFNDKPEPTYDIKIATSPNAIDWEPLSSIAVPLEGTEGGISKASIIPYKDYFLMWYSIRMESDYRTNPTNSYRIKCVKSNDLMHWEKMDNFGLDIDPTSHWDNIMVEYPHVVDFDHKLHLFYNGNGFGKTGIGHAIWEE